METIGLIAAMSQESAALMRCTSGWKKTSVGELKGYRAELSSCDCILVTSGMGMKRATEAARKLIEINSVQVLISFGIAGAVEASLKIGDVILLEGVCQWVSGALTPSIAMERWQGRACEAARQVLVRCSAELYPGTAITTGGSQLSEAQLVGINHPVLEMETMGIALVAQQKKIPFLGVRAISDGPVAPIPFDLGEVMDENANLQIGKLLRNIVLHPGMIGILGEMMRNSRIAADNAAIALMQLLSHHFASAG